ncbi:carbohydrate ABC transporter permease [Nocardioides sp. GY 10127]|uniref:carbohydrate ABC transporter permease n=1 Tax=Nocardioides sp. GY 10127 TaxID=2569762 RepID=UPI0010A7FF5C|nr:carbohydrate ABC transporter permease [Nocardioides sp. GY 10127]TIC82753.1 carbohydrate ABC transporter permease [Nocardioides sp. GY 10127]
MSTTSAPATSPLRLVPLEEHGRPPRARLRPAAVLKYVVLTLVAVPWVGLPLWMLVVNAGKTTQEAAIPSVSLPSHWSFADNLSVVLDQGHYLTGLRNSLLVTVPVVVLVLLLGSMAAWTFARTPWRWLRVWYYVFALSIILPPAIVPTVVILTRTGLTGTVAGYALALVGTRLGIIVFLTTGYLRTLPSDYEDAAQMDGAGRWQTFRHVILPLLQPVLFTAAVMTVINVWNDFLFALYMIQGSDNATLPLTLYQFSSAGQYSINWNLVFMHVILTSAPLLIAYVVLQKRIMSGLTDGGVTG